MTTFKIGPDYDPATGELLHDSKGNPITQEYIDQVSAEAEEGYDLESLTPVKLGRPSLSRKGLSPEIHFRVSVDVQAEVKKLADHEGRTISELARIALEEYLASHKSA